MQRATYYEICAFLFPLYRLLLKVYLISGKHLINIFHKQMRPPDRMRGGRGYSGAVFTDSSTDSGGRTWVSKAQTSPSCRRRATLSMVATVAPTRCRTSKTTLSKVILNAAGPAPESGASTSRARTPAAWPA